DACRGGRALQRPWRHLGRAQGQLRDGGEGGQACRPGSPQEQHALRDVGMPDGRRAPDAGDAIDRRGAPAGTVPRPPSHRAVRRRLWIDTMRITSPRKIETSAILPLSEYGKLRGERRRQMAEIKRIRRMEVGPFATFYFESYE